MTPEKIHTLQTRFASLLDPLGSAYAWGMRQRAALYHSGKIPRWRSSAPCISVGNISWGGTGKTPVVDWLLDWAVQEGLHHPTVLTRGYGGHPPRCPYAVKTISSAHEAGDEPLMLKRAHPDATILVDSNRTRAGKKAAEQAPPPAFFILDDGFQHLRVERDVDLCLLAPADLEASWNKVIPSGSWREDASALRRADAFLINRMFGEEDCLDALARIKLSVLGKPIFFFQVVARHLVNTLTAEEQYPSPESRILLVTGIANPHKAPQTFERDLHILPVEHLVYADHHPFSALDWKKIGARAEALKCTHIVCTPKDAVKLTPFADERLWIPYLSTSFTSSGAGDFSSWLRQRLQGIRKCSGTSESSGPFCAEELVSSAQLPAKSTD